MDPYVDAALDSSAFEHDVREFESFLSECQACHSRSEGRFFLPFLAFHRNSVCRIRELLRLRKVQPRLIYINHCDCPRATRFRDRGAKQADCTGAQNQHILTHAKP